MKMRFLLTAVAAAGCAVALLTGCQSNVGAAAHVGDRTISVADINDNVSALSQDKAEELGRSVEQLTVTSRQTVLIFTVRQLLFEDVFEKRGGVPDQATLDAKHDAAVKYLFGSSSADEGAAGDAAVKNALEANGVDTSFASTMLRSTELELVLAEEISAASEDDVAALVEDAGIDVRINDRYGSWDSKTLTLKAATPPAYLKTTSDLPTSAAPVPVS